MHPVREPQGSKTVLLWKDPKLVCLFKEHSSSALVPLLSWEPEAALEKSGGYQDPSLGSRLQPPKKCMSIRPTPWWEDLWSLSLYIPSLLPFQMSVLEMRPTRERGKGKPSTVSTHIFLENSFLGSWQHLQCETKQQKLQQPKSPISKQIFRKQKRGDIYGEQTTTK
jgi:hypothetical protein